MCTASHQIDTVKRQLGLMVSSTTYNIEIKQAMRSKYICNPEEGSRPSSLYEQNRKCAMRRRYMKYYSEILLKKRAYYGSVQISRLPFHRAFPGSYHQMFCQDKPLWTQ